jgi:3-oxoacyl-[acyl-carrier protein] reductase
MPAVALVTGGNRGIGLGITQRLLADGFAVSILATREEPTELLESLDAPGRVRYVRGSVADLEDHARFVDDAVEAWGRLDLLVNNAGVAPSVRADLLEAGPESFDRVLGINLRGPYFLTQLVARRMIDQTPTAGAPKIVIVSSISAYTASVNRGDYCLAKAGLGMMTALYAARLAEHGINVYEIRPGVIETDMTGPVKERYDRLIHDEGLTPIRRWGQPDDVGRAVVAVATDLLPFSTGQVIDVDGGFHLRTL